MQCCCDGGISVSRADSAFTKFTPNVRLQNAPSVEDWYKVNDVCGKSAMEKFSDQIIRGRLVTVVNVLTTINDPV